MTGILPAVCIITSLVSIPSVVVAGDQQPLFRAFTDGMTINEISWQFIMYAPFVSKCETFCEVKIGDISSKKQSKMFKYLRFDEGDESFFFLLERNRFRDMDFCIADVQDVIDDKFVYASLYLREMEFQLSNIDKALIPKYAGLLAAQIEAIATLGNLDIHLEPASSVDSAEAFEKALASLNNVMGDGINNLGNQSNSDDHADKLLKAALNSQITVLTTTIAVTQVFDRDLANRILESVRTQLSLLCKNLCPAIASLDEKLSALSDRLKTYNTKLFSAPNDASNWTMQSIREAMFVISDHKGERRPIDVAVYYNKQKREHALFGLMKRK
jgi:hypothetical protein